MSKITGVDAAVLAGLEIDFLQKLRNGQITIESYTWFLGLTKEVREQFVAEARSIALVRKFELVKDLGIIEVPADYVHVHLDRFVEANRKNLYGVNDNITDANFSAKSTTKLAPGRKLRVRVYKQTVSGTTTSGERMDFLRQQPGNVWLGAQGVTLVWPKREKLPKGFWYCSFDEPDALWQDSDGDHRVPRLDCSTDGDFSFYLGRFGHDWGPGHCLLSFCDEESLDA